MWVWVLGLGWEGRDRDISAQMKIYREGLSRSEWRGARRRGLHLAMARARMHTYGGMCHEHEGVILYIGAVVEGAKECRHEHMLSAFWGIEWVRNPSIIVEGMVVCKLWRGCFALRERVSRSRRSEGT